jgi:hypothetical protein
MTYEVKYKLSNKFKWNILPKVKGDGFIQESNNTYRFFILEDESRVEIPLGYLFKFGKERFFIIKENMEKESGTKLPV